MRRPRPAALVGFLVLAAVAASALAVGGAGVWTSTTARGRLFAPGAVPAHDAAIVFGAEVYPDGTPAPFTAARLDLGARLYAAGKARVLVVSGDNRPEHNRETEAMSRYLQGKGVPASRIVQDPWGVDTYDTCIRARDVYGLGSAILVSQAYHLPRAITACVSLGVDAVGVGDTTVENRDFYPYGVAREFPANVKLAWNVWARSAPAVAGPRSAAVADALRS